MESLALILAWAAPTVSYLWPTRPELSRKVSEDRKFLGQNISVICPGSCRVTEIQITSCPSKKEFLTLSIESISVIWNGVVPARKIISEAPFLIFWFSDFLISEAGALFSCQRKGLKGGVRGPRWFWPSNIHRGISEELRQRLEQPHSFPRGLLFACSNGQRSSSVMLLRKFWGLQVGDANGHYDLLCGFWAAIEWLQPPRVAKGLRQQRPEIMGWWNWNNLRGEWQGNGCVVKSRGKAANKRMLGASASKGSNHYPHGGGTQFGSNAWGYRNGPPLVLPALPAEARRWFFFFFGREILREIWRDFCGIFSDPQNKGLENFGENLREAKPGGFQTGGFPTFFGKGPDYVTDPFGTVPRRCS